MNPNNLNIITWNANSIKNKLAELSQVIIDYNVDILGICETKISNNFNLKVTGFSVYRNDRNSAGGGVALIIKKNIYHSQFVLPPLNTIEAVAVQVQSAHGPLLILCVYIAPSTKLDINELKKIFNLSNKIILFGDFKLN